MTTTTSDALNQTQVLAVTGSEGRWQMADILMIPGCHTQAKSTQELHKNVQDVFWSSVECAADSPAEAEYWYPGMDCLQDYYLSCDTTREGIENLAAATVHHHKTPECDCEQEDLLCRAAKGVLEMMQKHDMPSGKIEIFDV